MWLVVFLYKLFVYEDGIVSKVLGRMGRMINGGGELVECWLFYYNE